MYMYIYIYIYMNIYIYIYVYIYIYIPTGPLTPSLGSRIRRLERCLPGARLESFGVQVGGIGGPSWGFGWPFGVYVGSCGAPMGVWEVQRLHGRGLEGLGLAQGRLGTRIWVQHGSNLRQVGGHLGQPCVQLEPTWIHVGSR